MKKKLLLFSIPMLFGVLAFTQTRVVTGRVTDKNRNEVQFASVRLK